MASWDDQKSAEEVAALARALAHPMRVAILRVLRERTEQSVASLRASLPGTDTRGVLHHVAIMARAGVVDVRRGPLRVRLLRNVRIQTHGV